MPFDPRLLTEFIDTFYGYGTYSAPFWFVGMEEGGGHTLEENLRKVTNWHNHGCKELGSFMADSQSGVATRWFCNHPPVQSTWGKLIRILLAAQGRQHITADHLRDYQRDHLARSNGDTCLLELLPLPSPTTGHWLFDEYAGLPQLKTRDAYKEYYGRLRALHIAQRVQEHGPAVVIFYSFDSWYRQYWELIAGVPFVEQSGPQGTFYFASNSRTSFAIVKHPVSRGLTNHYWHWVGETLSPASKS
ncbi:MAG TPA: hypothetical protein VLQ48_03750 [Chloroflexia bacterium]|nr:hypothetical protein [Chloroflexia bacterium]